MLIKELDNGTLFSVDRNIFKVNWKNTKLVDKVSRIIPFLSKIPLLGSNIFNLRTHYIKFIDKHLSDILPSELSKLQSLRGIQQFDRDIKALNDIDLGHNSIILQQAKAKLFTHEQNIAFGFDGSENERASAFLNLGKYYANGFGVEKDPEAAKEHLSHIINLKCKETYKIKASQTIYELFVKGSLDLDDLEKRNYLWRAQMLIRTQGTFKRCR